MGSYKKLVFARCVYLFAGLFGSFVAASEVRGAVSPPHADSTSEQVAQAAHSVASAGTTLSAELQVLMTELHQLRGLSAHFVEEKEMELLAVPLRNEGEVALLQTSSGAMFARVTTKPQASRVWLRDKSIHMEQGAATSTIDLAGAPLVKLFVDSFVGLFSGDEAALRALYKIQGSLERGPNGERRWELKLVPRQNALAKVFASISLKGTELVISEMIVVETNGDRTRTEFSGVDTNRKFSPAESAAFFGPGPVANSGKK